MISEHVRCLLCFPIVSCIEICYNILGEIANFEVRKAKWRTLRECVLAEPGVLFSAEVIAEAEERSGTAAVTVDENGRRHMTGDKTGALKETQEYTREFGIAVHNAYPAVIINSDNLDIQHEGNDMCGNMSRAHPTNNEPITKLTNNDC